MTKVICWQSLNPKNQVLHTSKPVFFNDPINTNHKQISLTGTDNFNSKLFSLRKKQSFSFFNISENLQENHRKLYFWYVHFAPHYIRACIELLISVEQYILLWTRTIYGFFNIWSIEKTIFSFVSIGEGFCYIVNRECVKRGCMQLRMTASWYKKVAWSCLLLPLTSDITTWDMLLHKLSSWWQDCASSWYTIQRFTIQWWTIHP